MDIRRVEQRNVASMQDKVFKLCVSKCAKRDHTNFAGETIHHTVYNCMENCGYKW